MQELMEEQVRKLRTENRRLRKLNYNLEEENSKIQDAREFYLKEVERLKKKKKKTQKKEESPIFFKLCDEADVLSPICTGMCDNM
jgi:hypothetical protein